MEADEAGHGADGLLSPEPKANGEAFNSEFLN